MKEYLMKRLKTLVFSLMILATLSSPVFAEKVITHWGGDASLAYDTGFMKMCMKADSGTSVSLFNMELMANDAPGSGFSEKGVRSDVIWGQNRARKILNIDDPRAFKAWLVIFTYRQGKYPLKFKVNDKERQVDNWDMRKNGEPYRYAEFPAEWLKKGKNTIELYSPRRKRPPKAGKYILPAQMNSRLAAETLPMLARLPSNRSTAASHGKKVLLALLARHGARIHNPCKP